MRGFAAKLTMMIATTVLLSSAFVPLSSTSRAAEAGWQTFVVDSNGGFSSSMANDSWGHLHMVYFDQTNHDLKYANNTSGIWVTQTVESIGDTGPGCSIAIDQQGWAHISYYNWSVNNLNYATNEGGSWNIVTVDGGGNVGPSTSISLDSQGFSHISYWADTNLGGHLGYATNTAGDWSLETVDPNGSHGSDSSIAIDSNDNVHISYYGAGYLHHASNAAGYWSIDTLDGPYGVGTLSSIAIDADNNVHIAYNHFDAPSAPHILKYVNNTAGSWINSTVDDSSNNVGDYCSLALDPQGYAHISYLVGSQGIRYATNAGGAWDKVWVDDDGRYQTSILLDQDGYVYIAYMAWHSTAQKYSTNAPVVDTQDPTVEITAPTSSSTYATTSGMLTLSGSATDDVGVTSVSWSNPATGGSGFASGTTSWSISGIALASGDNLIAVTAFDAAGNNATDTITVTYTPDLVDPTIQIYSPADTGYYATGQNYVVISGIASDDVGVTIVTWANAETGGSGSAIGTTSWRLNISLNAGNNSITVTAHDAADNAASTSIAVNYTVSMDVVDPTASITSPTTGSTYATNSSTVSLSGIASDNVGVTSVTWSNVGTQASGTAIGTASWSISDILLVSGDNVIMVTAHDAGGNSGIHVLTVTFNAPDVTDPIISITSPPGATFNTGSSTLTMSGSSSDNVDVVNITWSNSRGGSGMATISGESWSVTTIPLQEGSNVITITAKDAANNTATAIITVTSTAETVDSGGLGIEVIVALVGVVFVVAMFVLFLVWKRKKKKA